LLDFFLNGRRKELEDILRVCIPIQTYTKFKMPPKGGPSNKSIQKAKDKIIEDKTFGLKNKNKSQAVKKYCEEVARNVNQSGGKAAQQKKAEAMQRQAQKEEKQRREEAMALLFKEVNKEKSADPSVGPNGEPLVKVYDEATGTYLWQAEDFEAVEHDDRRLEEQLEEELAVVRARPAAELTKVTPESFAIWKAQKKKEKEEAQERELRKMMSEFQKKGHGISGRNLWSHDATLFVDDDDAADNAEYALEEEEEAEEEEKGQVDGAAGGPVDATLFTMDEDLPEEEEETN